MTINIVQLYYLSFKTHVENTIVFLIFLRFDFKLIYILKKAFISRFSLNIVANHIFQINNQWEI